MKYRRLGKTGIKISEIGFGAWGIGGTQGGSVAYGPTEDRESKRALRLAYDLGITFYDTADFYGFGHSETLIGEALREVRQKIVIATKGGLLSRAGDSDFSSEHLRCSVEKSLKRLQTDAIDLYQLHNPSMDDLKENRGGFQVLEELKRDGKIKAVGLAARSPKEALQAAGEFAFDALQVNFNLADQRAHCDGLFDYCLRNGVGLIVRTPLCFGFLSGEYSPNGSHEEGDHRRFWSLEQRRRWHEAAKLFSDSCGNGRQTKVQMALCFCLSYPSVSTVIPGMLTREHVRENAAASGLDPFPNETLSRMEQIYREHTFFLQNG